MSEQERLFRMECEPTMTEHEQAMQDFFQEAQLLSNEEIGALREAELQSYSDTEQRIHMLNRIIESRDE